MTPARSTVRFTVPKAGDIVAPFLLSATAAAFVGATANSWLAYSLAVVIALVAAVFLLGILAPGKFKRGVCVSEDGFEVWRPLRRAIVIRYSDVVSVTAVARGDGDTNDDLIFRIGTRPATVSLEDADLFNTSVFDALRQIPGFSEASYAAARSHRATLLQALFGQRFTLLVRGYR